VLSAFVVYQLYRIALQGTFGMVALTVFDLVIALTIREYKRQREARRTSPDGAGAPSGAA
jgi:uncharacterized membrane protein